MKSSKAFLKTTFFTLTVLIVASCASMGQLSGDWQTYDKNYDEMKNVLQKAIYGGGLQIISEDESDDGTLLTLKIEDKNRYGAQGGETVEEGYVYLRKEEGESAVKVENPDYHYTVPNFERKDFKRRVFNRIDVVLDK